MEPTSMVLALLVFFGVIVLFNGLVTVSQGTVAVVTMFGKFRRIMHPGLNFKIPIFEGILRRISIQNQSIELKFQAITADQANVNFKAMLLFAVIDQREETIMKVAFKFIDVQSLMQALVR